MHTFIGYLSTFVPLLLNFFKLPLPLLTCITSRESPFLLLDCNFNALNLGTWLKLTVFPLLVSLLTLSGETKLRQLASGETITGTLLFQSWGHPSARCSRDKGQGFIAGSTVWKETHFNIVWFFFLEIAGRHPYYFLYFYEAGQFASEFCFHYFMSFCLVVP